MSARQLQRCGMVTNIFRGLIGAVSVVAILFWSQSAAADLRRLKVAFGPGCKSNSKSCTVNVQGTGSALSRTKVMLQFATSKRGSYQLVTNRQRSLDSDGRAAFRFQNFTACFRSVTAPNGDAKDVVSNVICQGGAGSSSSTSSSSNSSASSVSSGSSSSSSSDDNDNSSSSKSSKGSSSSLRAFEES